MPIPNPKSQIPNFPHPPRLRASAGNPSRFGFSAFPHSAFSSSALRRRFAPSTFVSRPSTGFTLVELLVVISVIAILAGLTLAAVGGIQQRGARAKAEGEIQALSAAIEDYHRKLGVYPDMDNLYAELTADPKAKLNTTDVFFEPTPGIVNTNTPGEKFFQDPWGDAYIYETNAEKIRNRGFFDLSSKAGGKGDPIRN